MCSIKQKCDSELNLLWVLDFPLVLEAPESVTHRKSVLSVFFLSDAVMNSSRNVTVYHAVHGGHLLPPLTADCSTEASWGSWTLLSLLVGFHVVHVHIYIREYAYI